MVALVPQCSPEATALRLLHEGLIPQTRVKKTVFALCFTGINNMIIPPTIKHTKSTSKRNIRGKIEDPISPSRAADGGGEGRKRLLPSSCLCLYSPVALAAGQHYFFHYVWWRLDEVAQIF